MSDLFPGADRPLTPQNALEDYRWLRAHDYWRDHSLLEFTKKHWMPMYEQSLIWQLSTRMKFNSRGQPRQLALALRQAREGVEAAYRFAQEVQQ